MQKASEPVVRLASNDEARADRCLAICDYAASPDLLDLAIICLEHKVLALETLVQREEDDGFPVGVKLAGWLLHNWELALKCRESVVADRVCLLDVW